jgi:alkanesulfonate monooxygenase SsuD/methylene tetrahydromethanopterin reductase-like flavin-dependent oxidoreductase (luciferase family)
MRRSVKLNPLFEYPVLERFWRDADELGFHGVYVFDHLYGQRDSDVDPFEAWTILAAMAAATSRARIGLLVSPVTFRHPAVLAKMAVTVDHVSGGRLDVGLGAAWHKGEHDAYGIAFPPAGTRIAMLEEACVIIRRLWTEEVVDHEGRFWTLRGARGAPKPLQQPLPLVVGGSGARKTLRVVADHADEWSFPGGDLEDGPERFARLSAILDGHCQAAGRDAATVARSVTLLLHPDQPDQVRRQLGLVDQYDQGGADHVILGFSSPPPQRLLASLALS